MFFMDAAASLATHYRPLSSSASLFTVSRRHYLSGVCILSNRVLNTCALTKIDRRSFFCNAYMPTTIKAFGTEKIEDCFEEFHGSREHNVLSLSPLDECSSPEMENLRLLFSEYGLIRFRVLVEVKWLVKLSEISEVEEVGNFSEDARTFLEAIFDNFSINDALEVKKIEEKTNHDVKAVEYFLKQKCGSCPEVAKVLEFFHFACTSEDINNLAYALSLKEALNSVIFPEMVELTKSISSLAKKNAHIPLSSTHGHSASSTSLGEELASFAFSLCDKGNEFSKLSILGKFAGAVGNYSALEVAYSDIDWPCIAENFVTSLGIKFNGYVTQIEPHDYIARLFHTMIEFNNMLVDLYRDILSYMSEGYFKQTTTSTELGSSTMLHKIDPIDLYFEKSEENLCYANAFLSEFAMKLPISRMQRDLSDSTVMRNIGVALGLSLLGYTSALRGFLKLQEMSEEAKSDLQNLSTGSHTGKVEELAKSIDHALGLLEGLRLR